MEGSQIPKNTVDCATGFSEIESNHKNLKGKKGHNFCSGCTEYLINDCLETPKTKMPMKCNPAESCFELLDPVLVESGLTDTQRRVYLDLVFMEEQKEDTFPINCTKGGLMQYWPKDSSQNFLLGENPDGKSKICSICRKTLGFDGCKDQNEKYNIIEQHFKGFEHKEIKEDFEEIVVKGKVRKGPDCGYAGIKDDAGTHIECPQGPTTWGYMCGLSSTEANKSSSKSNIFRHNDDWEENPKRCPLYLK